MLSITEISQLFDNIAKRRTRKPSRLYAMSMITPTQEGWATSGEFGFEIKRWSRNTKGGFPIGSASWDNDGIWAHWIMAFADNGQVIFEKHSRQGVEVAVLDCEYALGPPKNR
jgi:hypothetical protein